MNNHSLADSKQSAASGGQGGNLDSAARNQRIQTPSASRRRPSFRRTSDHTVHPLEERFKSALFIPGDAILTHDAEDLLGYVRGLLEAAAAIVAFATDIGSASTSQHQSLQRVRYTAFCPVAWT